VVIQTGRLQREHEKPFIWKVFRWDCSRAGETNTEKNSEEIEKEEITDAQTIL
jgi:hypothetical protein